MSAPNQNTTDDGASVPDLMKGRPVAELSATAKQGIELIRQHTQVAAEIAGLQWGSGMTPVLRRAVTSWAERYGVDANTELDVLGGSFYVNAEFYIRKMGELRRSGVIADFWYEHIHADPRLKTLMEDKAYPESVRTRATELWTSAMLKRIEHNAPEDAKAICVFYITLPEGGHPIIGCKWAGNATSVKQPRSGGGGSPNPIAESNPELSVVSMAARRAARQIISHMNGDVPNFDRMEAELEGLSEQFSRALSVQNAGNRALEGESTAPRALVQGGYEALDGKIKDAEEITVSSYKLTEPGGMEALTFSPPLNHEQLKQVAAMDSPYDDAPAPVNDAVLVPMHGCAKCSKTVRRGEPSDHAPDCPYYAD